MNVQTSILGRLCTNSLWSGISLCNLCVLCVSVVWSYSEFINHRGTEDTEVAQRRARSRLFVQSRYWTVFHGKMRRGLSFQRVHTIRRQVLLTILSSLPPTCEAACLQVISSPRGRVWRCLPR